ncbi:Histidine kinase-, DNA gyrase B-, and HSP90-like ATPase [Eubacterium ruminantium]|uniref:Histidine kinase-, DNA gyrase B-, and HSP90-like ATPase n=1 Tax=Eubacterium ruminantium TaxID=42322 RepID=A0A1T4QB59_9FIRM|nr:histidine kinase [Eubacterium ruminantium]SCW66958.1 Histidine kinase-, DNA gyrase B-, and HSP90-like ATPase [Eubacterium ruminantium]SDN35612.1 Histidine kinase-, DNA gyrase B-, and HSP90-like ATPase [Eubacterium ruminantium]SKA01012.1 Histidine kinase-, DNA gyrase B-, and HSP90-like ATPase [Eubacterium ruminantium]
MLDYILKSLISYSLVPVFLQVFILIFVVIADPYIMKKQKRIMMIITILVICLIFDNLLSYYLSTSRSIIYLRTIESIFGYSIRPVIIVLFFYIVNPQKKYHLFWLLVDLNIIIYMTALFSPIAFSISKDNHFIRGPLGFTSHITCVILILYLMAISLFEWRFTRGIMMFIPIINTFLIIIAIIMDSFVVTEDNRLTFLTITVVSCTLFYYVWLHLKFAHEYEEKLRNQQRTKLMLSQINPHFMINSLGAIKELCDSKEARVAVDQFARYLQGNMETMMRQDIISFKSELEHTKAYLALEQIRFEDALQIKYDITCSDFGISTLSLQPIVENAVRHGVRGSEKDVGTVIISTREFDDRYEIKVSDDGVGFDPDNIKPKNDGREHIGIQNVRDRLKAVCNAEMIIESTPGEGTDVSIIIPKREGEGLC